MYEQVLRPGVAAVRSTPPEHKHANHNSSCQNPSSGVLVFALGNSLRGDDGIGPKILQALAKQGDLPSKTILLEGDAWTLTSLLQSGSFRRVILLDAMEMGGFPGDWRRFDFDKHGSYLHKARQQAGTHRLNLDTMLALLEILGIELPELIVYGVQPESMNWSANLSEKVLLTIPTLCKHILKDLEEG